MDAAVATKKRLRLEALDKAMSYGTSANSASVDGATHKRKRIRQKTTRTKAKGQVNVYKPLPRDLLSGPVGEALGLTAFNGGSVPPIRSVIEDLLEPRGWRESVVRACTEDCGNKVLTLLNPTTELIGHAKGLAKRRQDDKRGAKSRKRKKPSGTVRKGPSEWGSDSCEARRDWDKSMYSGLVEANRRWFKDLKLAIERSRSPEDAVFSMCMKGAHLAVVSCRNPVYAKTTGIVLKDEGPSFRLMEKGGRMRTVPKHGSVFRIRVDGKRVVTIFGDKYEEALEQNQKCTSKTQRSKFG